MEPARRSEQPFPPGVARAIPQRRNKRAEEEDFDATINDLVRYYATLPPGALEASVREQPAAEMDDIALTQEVRAQRQPRPMWVLVLGGATSMILGGVVTFALIVGRPDFWRAADRPVVVATPKISITETGPQRSTKGIPKAEPLVDIPEQSPAGAEGVANAVTENAAKEAVKVAPAKRSEPRATNRVVRSDRERRVRRQRRRPAPVRRTPKSVGATGFDDWEDPYK